MLYTKQQEKGCDLVQGASVMNVRVRSYVGSERLVSKKEHSAAKISIRVLVLFPAGVPVSNFGIVLHRDRSFMEDSALCAGKVNAPKCRDLSTTGLSPLRST